MVAGKNTEREEEDNRERSDKETDGIAQKTVDDCLFEAPSEEPIPYTYYNDYATGIWGDVSNYDLCVDTGTLGIEGSVELILKCVEIKKKMIEDEEKEW